MQRLLTKAEELEGLEVGAFDINNFADVADAIHIIQEEMGITGTTALEASETIAGSAATMKSAWENLVVGLADENANVDELLDNFLDSVETTAGNILPVVERVLSSIFSALEENGPEMIVSGAKLLGKLAAGAVEAIPEVVAKIPDIVMAIVDGFAEAGPEFKEIGAAIVQGIWTGIQNLGSWLWGKVSGFFGDLVDGVKESLGIHSPSRVFAGIGENMALGLGEGWKNEYGAVKTGITDGLNFGTASIPFSSSGLGASTAGIINSGASGDGASPLTVNLVMPDGTPLASYLLPYLVRVADSNGTPIANPITA